jgi:hypothetical protein
MPSKNRTEPEADWWRLRPRQANQALSTWGGIADPEGSQSVHEARGNPGHQKQQKIGDHIGDKTIV